MIGTPLTKHEMKKVYNAYRLNFMIKHTVQYSHLLLHACIKSAIPSSFSYSCTWDRLINRGLVSCVVVSITVSAYNIALTVTHTCVSHSKYAIIYTPPSISTILLSQILPCIDIVTMRRGRTSCMHHLKYIRFNFVAIKMHRFIPRPPPHPKPCYYSWSHSLPHRIVHIAVLQ